jgi:hypothetical protein
LVSRKGNYPRIWVSIKYYKLSLPFISPRSESFTHNPLQVHTFMSRKAHIFCKIDSTSSPSHYRPCYISTMVKMHFVHSYIITFSNITHNFLHYAHNYIRFPSKNYDSFMTNIKCMKIKKMCYFKTFLITNVNLFDY